MSVFVFLQQQCSVVAAEAEAVCDGVFQITLDGAVRHVVQIAVRVRMFESDCRMDFAVSQAECRDDEFHAATDRKSTRLNSSHVSISYAVFCLKKKRMKVTRS